MTTTTTNADDAMKRVYALEAKCLALEADAATASSRAREHADALAKAQARFRELDEAKTLALEARDATVRALENKVRELQVQREHAASEVAELRHALDVRTAEVDALLRDRIRAPETRGDGVESSDDDVASAMLHLKRELMTYKAHFAAFTHDMDAIRHEMKHCESNMRDVRVVLAGKDDENAKHAERIARLEAELVETLDVMREFPARDAKRAHELAITRRALDAAKAQTRRLEAELDVLDFAAKSAK